MIRRKRKMMNKVMEYFTLLILLSHKAKSDCLENIRKVETSNQNAPTFLLLKKSCFNGILDISHKKQPNSKFKKF